MDADWIPISQSDMLAYGEKCCRSATALQVLLVARVNVDADHSTIRLSREQLARRIGCRPKDISEVMTDLASSGLIEIERVGRRAIYRFSWRAWTRPVPRADLDQPTPSQ